MKLRIQGNSLRLRVSPSDMASFIESGRIEETIYFAANAGAELTYVLLRDNRPMIEVESVPGRVTVLLPTEMAQTWAMTEEVGIAGEVDLGIRGTLSVLVEKDFACLHPNLNESEDSFPNPLATHGS